MHCENWGAKKERTHNFHRASACCIFESMNATIHKQSFSSSQIFSTFQHLTLLSPLSVRSPPPPTFPSLSLFFSLPNSLSLSLYFSLFYLLPSSLSTLGLPLSLLLLPFSLSFQTILLKNKRPRNMSKDGEGSNSRIWKGKSGRNGPLQELIYCGVSHQKKNGAQYLRSR